jgi:hypothetical protein
MSSVNQHQQDTPESSDLAEENVMVTDPHHPLFGCTFPLIRIVGEDDTKRSIVVRLPSGLERLVPVEVTDLSPVPMSATPLPLSLEGISRLLETHERIKRQTVEVQKLPLPSKPPRETEDVEGTTQKDNKERQPAPTAPNNLGFPMRLEDSSAGIPERIVATPEMEESHVSKQQPRSRSTDSTQGMGPQPCIGRLIKLGDVAQYLGVSQGLVTRFVLTSAIRTVTNPLDRRLKLVSTRELDEFKRWLTEIEKETGMARGSK